MHRTTFGGLTELDPGDPITIDGASFTNLNPRKTAFYLRVGAITHRHDAHAPLADPTAVASASVAPSGGQIASSLDIFVAYTLTDSDGGETRASEAVEVSTLDAPNAPSGAITAAFDPSGGSLPVGQFVYALTLNDPGGGESMLGPAAFVQREPGYASGQVQLAGLSQELGGVWFSWNLWRAQDGGNFEIIAANRTEDTFTDTGLICTDAARTPPAVMTGVLATNMLTVVLPTAGQDPAVASATSIGLYLSLDGAFSNPSLYADYPVASAGVPIEITQIVLQEGSPPSVSTASQGANKINPDTDMLNFPWKRPVATAADLPASGNEDGDMRETLDTHTLYVWDEGGGAWAPGGGVVGTRGSLWYSGHGAPGAIGGQRDNDFYIDEDTGNYYELASGVWALLGNLMGPAGANGASGARGSLWYTGHGAPGAIGGELNDDMYLDVDTGNYYQLIGGSWTLEGTIAGASTNAPERAHLAAATNTPGSGYWKVPIDTIDFGSNWDIANHRYVVPSTGKYRVFAQAMVQGADNLAVVVYKNGALVSSGGSGSPTGGYAGHSLADIIACTAGDHLELWQYAPSVRALVTDGTANYLTIEPI